MKNKFYGFILLVGLAFSSNAQTCDTTDIAYDKPVTVSSQVIWHEGPAAVDNNTSTWWQSHVDSGDLGYYYVDLEQSYTFCKVSINWGNNGKAKNYTIQVSTDATNWTTIDSVTNNSSNSNIRTVNGTGRYLRIKLTLRYYNWASYEIFDLTINNSVAGNSSPLTSITSPATSAQFYEGNNLTITATATDPDGSISKVEFYQGTTKIGEDVSTPYSCVWPNLQTGTYNLTSKAYDNDNAITTSSVVSITVNPSNRWTLTGNVITSSAFLGSTNNQPLVFKTNNLTQMTILPNGLVGIGTTTIPLPDSTDTNAKLIVKGNIYAKKLTVTQSNWADYVFNKDYKLLPLSRVESHIKRFNHLPGIPSAKEVSQDGVDVGKMQALLLEKVEELTLYIIQQNKKIEELEKKMKKLEIKNKK